MKIVDAVKNAFLAVKATYTASTLIVSDWYRGWTASWGALTFEKLAKLARENPYTGRGLRLIAETMAEVPISVYKDTTDAAGKPAEEEDPRHNLLKPLRRPYLDGRPVTWRRLCDAFVWGVYCGGDLFLEKRGPSTGQNAGTARELHILRNERFVRCVRDEQDMVTGFAFRNRRGKERTIAADDVLHVRTYNPTTAGNGVDDDDTGLPLLIAGRRALNIVEDADEWNRNLARNGGRVPGWLDPQNLQDGKQLTPEQVANAQEQVDEAVIKRRALNLPMVMSGSFKFTEGSISPREADWLKGRQSALREVAAVLGVPATLLGDEKAGSLTDSGVDSEMAALYKLTVLPMLSWLLEEISLWLLSDDQTERLAFDRDQIEVLQEDVNAIWERVGKAADEYEIITDDEARQVLGYDPLTPEQRAAIAERRTQKAPKRGRNAEPEPEPGNMPDESKALELVRKRLRERYATAA